jgi:pimeloyl-ACP methyl ester carboxylesterase
VLLSYVEQFGTDRLDGLAFVDQRPKFHGEADWSHTLTGSFDGHAATELATNLEYNRPAAAKPFVEAMLADPPGANVIDGMNAETTETPTGAAIELFLDMAYSDLRPVLDEVDVPRLLIYGEQSSIFPTDVGAYMGSAIPEATHLRFEGSGHCPFWEGPDRFNEAVVAFAGQ